MARLYKAAIIVVEFYVFSPFFCLLFDCAYILLGE